MSSKESQSDIFNKLSKPNSKRWIVEGDIKGCFDNIKHSHIIETLTSWGISDWIICLINKILTAGEITKGTPQGGIISPMLSNVALTCLDREVDRLSKDRMNPIVRYADDFIIVSKSREHAIAMKETITEYLKSKTGLELSTDKTHITEISEGFDFLGFNIRKYANNKLLIKPTKDSIKDIRQKIKETVAGNLNATGAYLIRKLNPILNGWANYYRHVVSKDIFSLTDSYVYNRISKWTIRKHQRRSKKWSVHRYFETVRDSKWNFSDKGLMLSRIDKIPIKRYVKVRSDVRLYSEKDKDYWERREFVNAMDSIYNSFELTKLFRQQKGICEYCQTSITQEDIQSGNIHKHHLLPKSENGTDKLCNLKLLHLECHKELHHRFSRKEMASYTVL